VVVGFTPITTNTMSSNPAHGEVYSFSIMTLCDKVCQ